MVLYMRKRSFHKIQASGIGHRASWVSGVLAWRAIAGESIFLSIGCVCLGIFAWEFRLLGVCPADGRVAMEI
jgi:hypothetical protein